MTASNRNATKENESLIKYTNITEIMATAEAEAKTTAMQLETASEQYCSGIAKMCISHPEMGHMLQSIWYTILAGKHLEASNRDKFIQNYSKAISILPLSMQGGNSYSLVVQELLKYGISLPKKLVTPEDIKRTNTTADTTARIQKGKEFLKAKQYAKALKEFTQARVNLEFEDRFYTDSRLFYMNYFDAMFLQMETYMRLALTNQSEHPELRAIAYHFVSFQVKNYPLDECYMALRLRRVAKIVLDLFPNSKEIYLLFVKNIDILANSPEVPADMRLKLKEIEKYFYVEHHKKALKGFNIPEAKEGAVTEITTIEKFIEMFDSLNKKNNCNDTDIGFLNRLLETATIFQNHHHLFKKNSQFVHRYVTVLGTIIKSCLRLGRGESEKNCVAILKHVLRCLNIGLHFYNHLLYFSFNSTARNLVAGLFLDVIKDSEFLKILLDILNVIKKYIQTKQALITDDKIIKLVMFRDELLLCAFIHQTNDVLKSLAGTAGDHKTSSNEREIARSSTQDSEFKSIEQEFNKFVSQSDFKAAYRVVNIPSLLYLHDPDFCRMYCRGVILYFENVLVPALSNQDKPGSDNYVELVRLIKCDMLDLLSLSKVQNYVIYEIGIFLLKHFLDDKDLLRYFITNLPLIVNVVGFNDVDLVSKILMLRRQIEDVIITGCKPSPEKIAEFKSTISDEKLAVSQKKKSKKKKDKKKTAGDSGDAKQDVTPAKQKEAEPAAESIVLPPAQPLPVENINVGRRCEILMTTLEQWHAISPTPLPPFLSVRIKDCLELSAQLLREIDLYYEDQQLQVLQDKLVPWRAVNTSADEKATPVQVEAQSGIGESADAILSRIVNNHEQTQLTSAELQTLKERFLPDYLNARANKIIAMQNQLIVDIRQYNQKYRVRLEKARLFAAKSIASSLDAVYKPPHDVAGEGNGNSNNGVLSSSKLSLV